MRSGEVHRLYYLHPCSTPSTSCDICVFLRVFQQIIDDTSEPAKGENHLAALTAGERVPWAKARKAYFSSGVNKASLSTVEKSAFVLALDDENYNYSAVSRETLTFRHMACGYVTCG